MFLSRAKVERFNWGAAQQMCVHGTMTASKGYSKTLTELLPTDKPNRKNVSCIDSALKRVVLALVFLEHGEC